MWCWVGSGGTSLPVPKESIIIFCLSGSEFYAQWGLYLQTLYHPMARYTHEQDPIPTYGTFLPLRSPCSQSNIFQKYQLPTSIPQILISSIGKKERKEKRETHTRQQRSSLPSTNPGGPHPPSQRVISRDWSQSRGIRRLCDGNVLAIATFLFFLPFLNHGKILLVLSWIIIFGFGIGLPVGYCWRYSPIFFCFGTCIGIGTVLMSGGFR